MAEDKLTTKIKTVEKVIDQKLSDKEIQITMFVITLVLLPFTMLLSLFLMGLTHAYSTFYWLKRKDEFIQLKGRKVITKINRIIVIGFISSFLLLIMNLQDELYGICGVMFHVGLIAGPAYFILTIKELKFYKKYLAKLQSRMI